MDQWFKDLFDIIKSQSKTNKMDLLLPELYTEFDILARNRNNSELKEIYKYIKHNNPIKTMDIDFNKKTFLILKKELMLRSILLSDLSVIDEEINDLIITNDQAGINEFINLWKDNLYIYNYLKDKTISEKPKTKKMVESKPVEIDPEINDDFDDDIEEDIIEELDEDIFEDESDIIKEEIKEEIKTPKPVKELSNIPYEKPKKLEIKKPPKKEIVARDNSQNPELKSFYEFVYKLNGLYNLNVNIEKLKLQKNPRRGVFNMLKEYIDQSEKTAEALLDLFNLIKDFNEYELIGYLANHSKVFMKVCTLNIGLLNEKEIAHKKQLIELVQDEVSEYISLSVCEISLREFIDYQNFSDETIDNINKYAVKASISTPNMVKAFEVVDCIEYFNNSLYPKESRVIDMDNITHLYWSMILACYISIYTERDVESDYTKCIRFITEIALKMIQLIDDDSIKLVIKTLAISYVRRAYNSALKCDNYENWWERQKDDLLDAKLESVYFLNE
ncbi:hypothetical protein ACAG96_00220 [Candidatus Izemoplasma sp. B36]|uniref:hypothetical protein n=1 Tax=Candidatus Izemoplasma sp. B36 TaxID=3242468 RepID=UPI0035570614